MRMDGYRHTDRASVGLQMQGACGIIARVTQFWQTALADGRPAPMRSKVVSPVFSSEAKTGDCALFLDELSSSFDCGAAEFCSPRPSESSYANNIQASLRTCCVFYNNKPVFFPIPYKEWSKIRDRGGIYGVGVGVLLFSEGNLLIPRRSSSVGIFQNQYHFFSGVLNYCPQVSFSNIVSQCQTELLEEVGIRPSELVLLEPSATALIDHQNQFLNYLISFQLRPPLCSKFVESDCGLYPKDGAGRWEHEYILPVPS